MPDQRYRGGPAGITVTPDQIRVLEALLRRTLPQATTRSNSAVTHRALQRAFHRWLRLYGDAPGEDLLQSTTSVNH